MRAVQVTRFGDPEVLVTREVPDPVAGPGQVVVEVSAADVLALDAWLRRGEGVEYFGLEPPYVPGDGVAGKVISAGEGVDPGWVGRNVVATTGVSGGYAERAVVTVQELIAVPDALGLTEAAALIHDGRTGLALAEGARIRPGERVLVMPAGSGLGLTLVQLARAAGAQVIAAARGQAKLDLARELGAEVAVDYTEPGWAERALEESGGKGIDVVFDGVGGRIGEAAFAVTAHGGRFSAYGDSSGEYARLDQQETESRGVMVLGTEQVHIGGTELARRLAKQALSEAAAGRIRPVIGPTFPLERAVEAHTAIEARTAVGRILLLI
jgi:NADPH2:quinone reductase